MRFKKLFSFCLIIAAAFLLTACNNFMEKEEHEHKVSVEWSNDKNSHWHTCEGCDDLLDKTAHVFGEWEVKVEATEETVGSRERSCSVCEYVETEEQKNKLLELGCRWYQGYLYSKPVSLEDFIHFLKQHNEKCDD